MDKLITALGPVFAAGLGIQQLMEILDPLVEKIFPNYKKVFLGVVSLAAGLILAFSADLYVLHLLGALAPNEQESLDAALTGVIISGGTEGINSILKFLKYKKEETKTDAAAKLSSGTRALDIGPTLAPTPEALADINRK